MKLRQSLLALALTTVVSASLSDVYAETIVLKSGDKLEGTVIYAGGSTMAIKLPEQGMRQLAFNAIDQIEITLSSGEQVIGRFVGWSGNTYEIQVGNQLLSVRDGEVLLTVAADPDPVEDADTAAEHSNGVGGPRIALTEPGKVIEAVAVEDVPSVAESSLPSITGSALPMDENAGEVVFELNLSVASDYPVAVIYSVVDGSATSGTDFQQEAGVLIIKAGAKSAEVTVPLIDDDQSESDEEFGLFLSVDPKVVSVGDRRITATIRDNDS